MTNGLLFVSCATQAKIGKLLIDSKRGEMMASSIFSRMRQAGMGVDLSKSKLAEMMLEILIQLPTGTVGLKDIVVANMGIIGQMSSNKELNEAWKATKKKAAKQYPEKFVLGERDILFWNDGSVEILDKKIILVHYIDAYDKSISTQNFVVTS